MASPSDTIAGNAALQSHSDELQIALREALPQAQDQDPMAIGPLGQRESIAEVRESRYGPVSNRRAERSAAITPRNNRGGRPPANRAEGSAAIALTDRASRSPPARGRPREDMVVEERRIVTVRPPSPMVQTPEKARLRGELAHLERVNSNLRSETEVEMAGQ